MTEPFDWAGLFKAAFVEFDKHPGDLQDGYDAADDYLRERIEAAFVPVEDMDLAAERFAVMRAEANVATARAEAAEAREAKLREALAEAIEWDACDEEGVPAVWLDKARAALGEDHDK